MIIRGIIVAAVLLIPTPANAPGANTAVTVITKTNGNVEGPEPRSRSPGIAMPETIVLPPMKKTVKKKVRKQICVRRNAKRCTWLKWVWH